MLKRWASIALCTLAVSAAPLGPWTPSARAATVTDVAEAAGAGPGPDLALSAQTPWVTPSAPWQRFAFAVRAAGVPASDLRVQMTFYGRIEDTSQLQEDMVSVPARSVLTRLALPVTASATGRSAETCVTVLPDASATPPAAAPGTAGACLAGGPTVVLDCTPDTGVCGDVYPLSVALVRAGSTTALSRFTTFMTYQEPAGPSGTGGPLQVSWVVPVGTAAGGIPGGITAADRAQAEQVVGELAANRGVTVSLAVGPRIVGDLLANGGRAGRQAVGVLGELTNSPGSDQLLPQSYVPVNVAALAGAGLSAELGEQMVRAGDVLRSAGLHPAQGPWVDTTSSFTTANASALATGVQAVGATGLVLNDSELAPAGSDKLTFAQPFTLALGRGHVTAAVANSTADARFTADAGDPVLAATQLLATLNWFHFEDAFTPDPRGVVITPPPSWDPQSAFVDTLLTGLTGNPALTPVTLDHLLSSVPQGGNNEPASRELQSGAVPSSQVVGTTAAARVTTARVALSSYSAAVSGHPALLGDLDDALLATESRSLDAAQRALAIASWNQRFGQVLSSISLGVERTITFTSRTAPIPVTVLSSAPYGVTVVLTIDSDKFTFPDGNSRTLHLDRPSTPVRVQAVARTSGDRLPVEVTLRTPNGQLVIAHAELTVHSTAISVVGIALTVLAGLTLLIWWARTWRRGRRHRPRAH